MWWNLASLLVVALTASFLIIPVRSGSIEEPDDQASRLSVGSMITKMYLTPVRTVALAGVFGSTIVAGVWIVCLDCPVLDVPSSAMKQQSSCCPFAGGGDHRSHTART
ncbi:hypothetical protein [Sphingomonas sp. IC4-52]|uniref:hypothetical protein n=1 Tax=Sphingomonas sp. IC4-52 TaxID=2887202 RepID=UPI001D118194|nr:hypothetical protein [Sphingomonas sp. IC4-52]MCC2978887.1 hypothetical protein [Sphingomonas sp. IC4-52]